MRWRPGHLALLVFQAVWLNIILPGHTRGVITLAAADCGSCSLGSGDTTLAGASRLCCSHSDRTRRPSHGRPTPREKANCAICAFAARVAPPPPVDFTPIHLGLLAVLPLPPPQLAVSLELIPTYYGNGPPTRPV